MTRIYYFSRTGTSEKLAKEIASKTDGKLCPITDSKNWKGPLGYIRAGYYASAKKTTPATYEKPEEGDTLYLCFPLWAGSFPPAVRTFIGEVGRERLIAVPCSKASSLADTEGFIKVLPMVGKDHGVPL